MENKKDIEIKEFKKAKEDFQNWWIFLVISIIIEGVIIYNLGGFIK